MKHIKQTLSLIGAAIMLSSCDPAHYNDLYFDNQSGYDIIFEYSGIYTYYNEDGRRCQGAQPVPNGEKTLMLEDGGIGCSGERDDKTDMFDWLYGDSVCFVIDSIHRISYYSYDTLSEDSPYNFNSPHYQHTYIDPNPGNGCDAAKSSHTYTITEEQINNRLGTQP
jgi:hypothetical protein